MRGTDGHWPSRSGPSTTHVTTATHVLGCVGGRSYVNDVMTISGRNFYTLPAVTCAEARTIFNHNARELGQSIVLNPVSSFI